MGPNRYARHLANSGIPVEVNDNFYMLNFLDNPSCFAGMIIQILFLFPCWAVHINTESLLILMDQDPKAAR